MVLKRSRHRKSKGNDLVLDLLYATISKDIKRVEELIECGIDPCTLMEDGTSPLHKAAVMENPYGALIISSMLRYGANPNVKTPTGLAPLHIAAMWGRVKTIDVLLDNGADVLVKDDDDRSALDYADEAEENRIECIDALTRYRGTTPCRAAPCFISKSRLNLDKIIGGDISLSTMSNEMSVYRSDLTPNRSDLTPCKSSVLENTSIRVDNVLAEQQARYGSKIRKSLLRRFSSFTKSRGVNVGVQTDTPKDKKNKEKKKKEKKKRKGSEESSKQSFIEEFVDKLDIDVPDGGPRKEKQSNEEHIDSFSRDDSNFLVSSTLLEDPTIYNTALSVPDLSSVKEEGRKNSSSSFSSSNSSNSKSSSSTSSNSSGSIELALRQSTPVTKDLVGSSCQMETIAVVHAPAKTSDTEANNSTLSSNSSSKQQHRPKIGWELGKITSKSSSKQTISTKDLKITQHGSNSNLYIPVPISTAKANNCNLSIKISIADGQTKKQLYTKKLGSVQITSPPQSGKKQKQKQRTKNEKSSKILQHCYEEIPPMPTPTTMLDQRPPSTTSASEQRLLSTTTFESAAEFQSDSVQYEEVGSVTKQEQVLRKTPTHSGDEKKNKKINTPPKRPPPPNFEKRVSVVQTKTENLLIPKKTENEENVTNKDIRVSKEPCVEPLIQPTMENFLESIPRQPVPPTLNRAPETEPSHPSPPRDDSLEPSLNNTTKESSNNTNSLYNITEELSGNANTSPIDPAVMSSEISEVSGSFVNLDASELTTYGDSTFEAKIELNQSTIDYIAPPVDHNAPTLDYISTANTDPPPSDTNKDGKIYTNTDANNIAPVSELVHYFEVRSVADESEVLDVSCPQLIKPDASCHMHEDGVSCNVEDYLNRQFQKLEDVIVTHQFDSGNVSDENCSSRSRSRSSPCNQGTKKISDGGTQKLLDAMKMHTPQIEEGDDVLGYAVSNSSLEDDVFLTPLVTNGEPQKNGLLRNAGQCSGTRLFELDEQSYSPRFPNDWNYFDQPVPTHSLKDSKNLILSNDVKSSQSKTSCGIEEKPEIKTITNVIENNPVLGSNKDVLTPRRSVSPNLNTVNKSRDNELHGFCMVGKSEYERPISIEEKQTQPITVQHSPEKRLNKQIPQPTSNNVKSSELYEDSSVESENQTVIDTHNCIHNCDEEDEEQKSQEDHQSWSSSSYGCDETDQMAPIKLPVVQVVRKPPRGILAEYGEVVVNYCWKDVCGFSSELEKSMISIPNRITTLHDDDLRMRLQKIGVSAHEITDKTRKIYQRYLVKVEKSHSKGMEAMEDYTTEMAQVMSGDIDLRGKDGELLEEEMKLQFMNPEKFTWREGTQSNSFNILLLDPRVTNNLPTRSRNMSYMETFKVFVSAIFFVGRGRRCRPNEQLEEAARYKTKLVNNKIRMIHDIWSSGLGVISLSAFNSIIPVEAFTREACMIEALGKSRLTNTKSGDLYGLASTWNTKKQRLLGIYILTKAMDEFLSQGEKQIRLNDIESVNELRNSSRLSMSPLGSVVKDDKLRNDVIRTSSYPSARTLKDAFFSVK